MAHSIPAATPDFKLRVAVQRVTGRKQVREYLYDNVSEVILSEAWAICTNPDCEQPWKPLTEFGFRNMGDGTARLQPRCHACRRVSSAKTPNAA